MGEATNNTSTGEFSRRISGCHQQQVRNEGQTFKIQLSAPPFEGEEIGGAFFWGDKLHIPQI